MSRAFERVDKETLKRDDQLVEVLKKIKEKVLSGHIVELKTLTNQSSEIDQISEKLPLSRPPSRTDPITSRTPITGRTEIDAIITQTERESRKFLDHSFNKQIIGPSNTVQQLNQVDQSSESEFSHQSFYSDEEPWNIEYINSNLKSVEERVDSENCAQVVLAVKTLFEQIRLLLNRSVGKKDVLHQYTVLAIRSLFILGNAMKVQGNYNHAILYYENCLNKFNINEPITKGKLLLEIGRVSFMAQNFQKSQQYLYEALLHFETQNWRLDIASTLVLLARLNGWLKNSETANKLCYEGLAIYREYLPEVHEHIADTFYILGELAYLKKDIDGAFQFVEQSISMRDQNNNEEVLKPNLCQAYNLLGILYGNSHDYKQSSNYFQKAIQCVKKDGLRRAQILQNWAVMQALDCNAELAQKGFLKARQIQILFTNKSNSPLKDRLDKNYLELIS